MTVLHLCRYDEAFAAYERLLSADGNWYSWSSYVNVMALYPFVLLGAKGPRVSEAGELTLWRSGIRLGHMFVELAIGCAQNISRYARMHRICTPLD